jgi:predicted signal transduction protein with EAL and GGDEF domain
MEEYIFRHRIRNFDMSNTDVLDALGIQDCSQKQFFRLLEATLDPLLALECKRDSDVLSRIGGEEFALLLPETDVDGAQAVAERLRMDMASAHQMAGCDPFSATVSIGVATAHWDDAGIVDLMKAADDALYEAKRGGRNQVVCFKKPPVAAETSDLQAVGQDTIPLVRTA